MVVLWAGGGGGVAEGVPVDARVEGGCFGLWA